jgi:formate dehydrogenase subunit delta
MSPEKLAYMANQIGRFFSHQPHDVAVASVETHLRRFWDPRMRREIIAHLDDPAVKLDPIVRAAVERLAPAPAA